jgi:hypothetical protein
MVSLPLSCSGQTLESFEKSIQRELALIRWLLFALTAPLLVRVVAVLVAVVVVALVVEEELMFAWVLVKELVNELVKELAKELAPLSMAELAKELAPPLVKELVMPLMEVELMLVLVVVFEAVSPVDILVARCTRTIRHWRGSNMPAFTNVVKKMANCV